MKKLEIACFNLASALIAQEHGADRVELCADIQLGGTTPTLDDVAQAQRQLDIELFIMIRPRGGDFSYSEEEFQQMKESIAQIKRLNIDGFVFGILNEDNSINIDQNSELVNLAKPMKCTFHRAFDKVTDYKAALEQVISCGFSTILTSGTFPNVMEGKVVLKDLVHLADNQITIMPGGGLRSTNILELDQLVNTTFYHSSALTDDSEIANPDEVAELKRKISSL